MLNPAPNFEREESKTMTPENFIYWLNGYLEIARPEVISKDQIEEIKNHVALVLKKETPKQATLNPNQTDKLRLYTCYNEGLVANESVKYPFGPPASC